MPTADSGPLRGLRIAALLVLCLSAVVAWPLISPDDSWPALGFGLAAVAGAVAVAGIDRRLDRAAADRAAAVERDRLADA